MDKNQKILLTLLSANLNINSISDIKSLSKNDWQKFLRITDSNRVSSLLYSLLRNSSEIISLPREIIDSLKKKYIKTTLTNSFLYHKFSKIIHNLNNAGVKIILIKGIHLAKLVYKDIGARPMSDIDILARKKDLKKIHSALTELDYQLEHDYKFYQKHHYHISYYHSKNDEIVEIHWTLEEPTSPFNINLSDIWANVQSDTIDKNKVYLLSPEHLLCYLCIHAAYNHNFNYGLLSMYDISKIIQHYGDNLSWNRLKKTAFKWGYEEPIYFSLLFVEKILKTCIPGNVLSFLAPDNVNPDALKLIIDQLFSNEEWESSKYSFISRLVLPAKGKDKLKKLFPPKIKILEIYPVLSNCGLIYLYYFIRANKIIFFRTLKEIKYILFKKALSKKK